MEFDSNNSDSCIECGGKLRWDRTHGHSYCEDCGLIFEESELKLSRDKGTGSGSGLDDLKDRHQYDHKYQSDTPARTTFKTVDIDKNKGKYKRLWNHQHNYCECCRNTSSQTDRDKVHVAERLADSLHMDEELIDKIKNIVLKLNGRAFNRIGGIYAVALGTIGYVDQQQIETTEDFKNRISVREFTDPEGERIYDHEQPRFQHLAAKHEVDWNAAIKKVRQKMSD